MTGHDRERVERRLRERARELTRNRAGDAAPSRHMPAAEDGTRLPDQARGAPAAGGYRRCVDCGREIAPERLEAIPEAVRCIDCQRRFEGR